MNQFTSARAAPDQSIEQSYDVAVAGAGIAGSSAAAALADRGWRVLLIERDTFPRHKVCGEFLSPEAQQSLQALGLYGPITELRPVTLSAARIVSTRQHTLQMRLPSAAWGLSRYALDARLARAAQDRGATLWTSSTLTGWHTGDGTVALRIRHKEDGTPAREMTVQPRAVLMACGRHTLAGLPPHTPASSPKQQPARYHVGVKCHYSRIEMPDQVELYLFQDGYTGINPVENGHTNVCLLVSYDRFARSGRSIPAMIEAAAAENSGFAQRLAGGHPVQESACAVAPVDIQRRPRPWDGAPLLGDSAAMISPLCGDGMAMALRSVELAVPLVDGFLRGKLSLEEWQARYCAAWQTEFGGRLRLGRILQPLLTRPSTADLLLMTGNLFPKLADYVLRATRGPVSSASVSGTPTV